MAKLTHAQRSEISRRAWRQRKPKGIDPYTGKPVYVGGVRYKGSLYHKTSLEAMKMGIPASVVSNPHEDNVYVVNLDNGTMGIWLGRSLTEVRSKVYTDLRDRYGRNWRERIGITGIYLATQEEVSWIKVMGGSIQGNPLRPRISSYTGPRLLRRNSYAFGPTGFRPPAKWWAKTIAGLRASYKPLPGMTKKMYHGAISRIAGGIWSRFTDETRIAIVKKYE